MISVFIATSGRSQMFRDMLESLKQTTPGYDIEAVAAIDDSPVSWDIANNYGVRVWYKSKRRGALQAWNDAFSMTNGDILVPAGDDQLFHEGWLKYALESHKERLDGYGVVGMNDLAYNGNTQVATMFLFDRKYCQDVMGGIFAPPMYSYLCVDLEWNEKAKMLGRFYWDERSKVEHLHSAHGKRPYDEHDLWKDQSIDVQADNNLFQDRKAQGFPVTWQPII
jgi:glycosyltransferase involved in cell wall biosynthesis